MLVFVNRSRGIKFILSREGVFMWLMKVNGCEFFVIFLVTFLPTLPPIPVVTPPSSLPVITPSLLHSFLFLLFRLPPPSLSSRPPFMPSFFLRLISDSESGPCTPVSKLSKPSQNYYLKPTGWLRFTAIKKKRS